ncbi:MAG: hypothetical protein KKD44_24200 [Proteobacteria bacterium]|nr:hypothetical protein [Pseudomonadota bacterium]
MAPSNQSKPICFGQLEKVFPKTENGLRESPERCIQACELKTECLRTALSKDPKANEVHEEKVDNAYDAGLLTFFERWSRKKQLNKQKNRT